MWALRRLAIAFEVELHMFLRPRTLFLVAIDFLSWDLVAIGLLSLFLVACICGSIQVIINVNVAVSFRRRNALQEMRKTKEETGGIW